MMPTPGPAQAISLPFDEKFAAKRFSAPNMLPWVGSREAANELGGPHPWMPIAPTASASGKAAGKFTARASFPAAQRLKCAALGAIDNRITHDL